MKSLIGRITATLLGSLLLSAGVIIALNAKTGSENVLAVAGGFLGCLFLIDAITGRR